MRATQLLRQQAALPPAAEQLQVGQRGRKSHSEAMEALAGEVERRARKAGKGIVLILAGEAEGVAAARRACPPLDALLPEPLALPDFSPKEVAILVDAMASPDLAAIALPVRASMTDTDSAFSPDMEPATILAIASTPSEFRGSDSVTTVTDAVRGTNARPMPIWSSSPLMTTVADRTCDIWEIILASTF